MKKTHTLTEIFNNTTAEEGNDAKLPSPSKSVVRNIMNYSSALMIYQSKYSGIMMKFVLN
ncbi:MAG: hypothetical protein R6T99_11240 [Bacteroidales bacterium]